MIVTSFDTAAVLGGLVLDLPFGAVYACRQVVSARMMARAAARLSWAAAFGGGAL